jgi:hypothetical protein
MTYNHEPQGKRFINVMFVEKGSIRPGERNIEKDYLFDFSSDRYMNVEPQGTEHYYLDFAWSNREQPDKLDAFFAFAEEALQDRDESVQSSLPTYYQLCALYLVEQGSDGLYEANKEAVISGVLSYLSADNVERKPQMNSLFWKLVERESSLFGNGYTPSLRYAEYMLDYYRIGGASSKLILPIFRMLRNGVKYNEDETYSVRIMQTMLQKYGEFFKQVMTALLRDDSCQEVVERYIASRLEHIAMLPGLQEEILFWLRQFDEALCAPYVQRQFMEKTKELLAKDPERIKSGRGLDKFLETYYKDRGNKRLQQFYDDLDLQARLAIIGHTNPAQITQPQLENIRYMFDDRPEMLSENLNAQERSVFDVLSCASFLLRNTNMREAESYTQLSSLGPKETDQLQDLLQRLLRGKVRSDSYEKIAYAFYISGSEQKDYAFDYRNMLDFVHRETAGGEELYDFLNWSATYPYFRGPNGGIPDDLKGVIRTYFNKTAHGALNKRDIWVKLKGVQNESFRQLYKEIRDAQSNAIVRFIRRWQK